MQVLHQAMNARISSVEQSLCAIGELSNRLSSLQSKVEEQNSLNQQLQAATEVKFESLHSKLEQALITQKSLIQDVEHIKGCISQHELDISEHQRRHTNAIVHVEKKLLEHCANMADEQDRKVHSINARIASDIDKVGKALTSTQAELQSTIRTFREASKADVEALRGELSDSIGRAVARSTESSIEECKTIRASFVSRCTAIENEMATKWKELDSLKRAKALESLDRSPMAGRYSSRENSDRNHRDYRDTLAYRIATSPPRSSHRLEFASPNRPHPSQHISYSSRPPSPTGAARRSSEYGWDRFSQHNGAAVDGQTAAPIFSAGGISDGVAETGRRSYELPQRGRLLSPELPSHRTGSSSSSSSYPSAPSTYPHMHPYRHSTTTGAAAAAARLSLSPGASRRLEREASPAMQSGGGNPIEATNPLKDIFSKFLDVYTSDQKSIHRRRVIPNYSVCSQ